MENKKETEIMRMENMTEEEIDKYIAERAKDATMKEAWVLFLIQDIRREYKELKVLYDDTFSR